MFLAGCANTLWKDANRQHRKQLKELSRSIRNTGSDLHTATEWVGTTNFGLRKPNFVIIHHTAQQSCNQTLRTFTNKRTSVSAHYVICRDGTVYHMLNDYLRAWHGGLAKWGPVTDINSSSIGIELDNNGTEPFDERQIHALLVLLDTLKKKHNIPAANFIGHADIAPTRKNDPGITFPWELLAENGFGRWYGDTTGIMLPVGFDHIQALRVIGYDVSDTTAAIRAFRQHYLRDTTTVWKQHHLKALYLLSKQ